MIKNSDDNLSGLEKLIGLSVDLHNLNASVQRRYEISIVQWLVLKKIIEQPGLSAGTLAEISRVHPSTLTPTINRLEAMDLIYIQERPTDLRRKLLITSWKGFETNLMCQKSFSKAMQVNGEFKVLDTNIEKIFKLTQGLISYVST